VEGKPPVTILNDLSLTFKAGEVSSIRYYFASFLYLSSIYT
jgi:hypothetical protein